MQQQKYFYSLLILIGVVAISVATKPKSTSTSPASPFKLYDNEQTTFKSPAGANMNIRFSKKIRHAESQAGGVPVATRIVLDVDESQLKQINFKKVKFM